MTCKPWILCSHFSLGNLGLSIQTLKILHCYEEVFIVLFTERHRSVVSCRYFFSLAIIRDIFTAFFQYNYCI